MATLLVVGLGNPGTAYAATRHNAGFMVVDAVGRRAQVDFRPGKGDFWYADAPCGRGRVMLLKPTTYMNRSGTAVVEALEQFGSAASDVLVVVDDFALALGTLRLRPGGSDGGHNGLASVIYHLQTDQFLRLRCGIRKEVMPPKELTADFVLSQFDPEELPIVGTMIERAADTVEEVQRSGVERAMSVCNASPSGSAQ